MDNVGLWVDVVVGILTIGSNVAILIIELLSIVHSIESTILLFGFSIAHSEYSSFDVTKS